jgi:hypothetical protein
MAVPVYEGPQEPLQGSSSDPGAATLVEDPPPADAPLEAPEAPIPTELTVTTPIAQYYRLPVDDDEVMFDVAGTAPPGAQVTWILLDSHGAQFQDHTEVVAADDAGAWSHVVNAHGPIDCMRVQFAIPAVDGSDHVTTVVSTPFDVIAHDAPAPPSLSTDEQTLRLQRHASFVDGGLGRPSSPELPFQGLPMDAANDPRVVMARELGRRGTSHGSVNDLGKAFLLLLDYVEQNDATLTPIGQAALEGRPPSLLV